MSLISAACFTLFLAWVVTRFNLSRRQDDIDHAPGPSSRTASWIWGHELTAFQGQALEYYSKWMYMYGPLFKIKAALFHRDIIVLGDHAAVQHLFADTMNYVKSPSIRPITANLMGKGLVWAEGQEHAYQRRLLSQAFSLENLKGMWVDIAECAEKLETTLTNLALSNGGSATVNIVPLASSCTLDIIGRVGFGHDFNFGKSPEAQEMAASWNQVINSGLTFRAFISRFILRAFPSITSLPLKVLRAQGEYKEVIGKLAKNIIQDGLHQEKRKNLLSILMTAQSEDDGLATPRIIDNIITFTFAGHETTSGILSFTLLELARHPDVQQKLRDEVIQYGGSLSYDGIQKLAYLDAVIKEGLRIHPPSARTERVAMKDDTIPLTFPIKAKYGRLLKSFIVSKGQVFHIPFTSMQVNPSVWGTDAAEFKPERWLTPGAMPPPKELPHGWSNLVAFCDGPRNCIGFRLALLEFKVILATLVRTLEFRTTDAIITTKLSVTLQAVVEGQAGIIPLKVTLPSHT